MKAYSPEELRRRYKSLPKAQRETISEFIDRQEELAASRSEQQESRLSSLTHRATGRLVFDDGPNVADPKPLHCITVELWDRDFGHHDYLGRGITDQDGFFEIWYDPKDVGRNTRPNVRIRVFDFDHQFDRDGEVTHHDRLIYTFDAQDDVTHEHFDFGQLAVPYWTYDSHAATPRVHVVRHGSPPQSYAHGRAVMLLKQAAHVELKHRLHLAEHKLNRHLPSLEHIQRAYPENLTIRLEKERPGYTRGDEFFGQRMLNGMSASIFDRDPRNPQRYWLHHHWTSYEQHDDFALPNVDMWFELRDDKMYPAEIALQFRQRGYTEPGAPLEPPISFTPASGERWEQAKRVARVSAALHAELDLHLVETHLNVEQFAIAAYRNLRRSPLRLLLSPHVKDVILINRDADTRLLGEHGYIPRATALTADGAGVRIRQSLGMLDWLNWRPREILCETHTYAKAAHLFWDTLTEYVDWFFAHYRQEIAQHWYEVHRFSNDLVQHGVPFFLCSYLRGWTQEDASPPLHTWYEPNERMDFSAVRPVVAGELRAISPITAADELDEVSRENMKQVSRYVIFHATFMHTWANSRQYDDGGELLYSGIGLRYGENGVLSPEQDHSIAQPPDLATDQLWFAWLLSNCNHGYITTNEEHDIHPQFIHLLQQRKEDFQNLGIDIATLQSRINI